MMMFMIICVEQLLTCIASGNLSVGQPPSYFLIAGRPAIGSLWCCASSLFIFGALCLAVERSGSAESLHPDI